MHPRLLAQPSSPLANTKPPEHLTLHDWYATHIVSGAVRADMTDDDALKIAKSAFVLADAMLQTRRSHIAASKRTLATRLRETAAKLDNMGYSADAHTRRRLAAIHEAEADVMQPKEQETK